jgi:hypothetical protein
VFFRVLKEKMAMAKVQKSSNAQCFGSPSEPIRNEYITIPKPLSKDSKRS